MKQIFQPMTTINDDYKLRRVLVDKLVAACYKRLAWYNWFNVAQMNQGIITGVSSGRENQFKSGCLASGSTHMSHAAGVTPELAALQANIE